MTIAISIRSCASCPFRTLEASGVSSCSVDGGALPKSKPTPTWCPLKKHEVRANMTSSAKKPGGKGKKS